jgi:hypothetical protein
MRGIRDRGVRRRSRLRRWFGILSEKRKESDQLNFQNEVFPVDNHLSRMIEVSATRTKQFHGIQTRSIEPPDRDDRILMAKSPLTRPKLRVFEPLRNKLQPRFRQHVSRVNQAVQLFCALLHGHARRSRVGRLRRTRAPRPGIVLNVQNHIQAFVVMRHECIEPAQVEVVLDEFFRHFQKVFVSCDRQGSLV